MYLRFDNETAVYSFNDFEKNKLLEVQEALKKSTGYPYKDIYPYLHDELVVKLINLIFKAYKKNSNVRIDYPKDINLNDYNLCEAYMYMLFDSFNQNLDEPDYIKKEIEKYVFEVDLDISGHYVTVYNNPKDVWKLKLKDICYFGNLWKQNFPTDPAAFEHAWFNNPYMKE